MDCTQSTQQACLSRVLIICRLSLLGCLKCIMSENGKCRCQVQPRLVVRKVVRASPRHLCLQICASDTCTLLRTDLKRFARAEVGEEAKEEGQRHSTSLRRPLQVPLCAPLWPRCPSAPSPPPLLHEPASYPPPPEHHLSTQKQLPTLKGLASMTGETIPTWLSAPFICRVTNPSNVPVSA